jgi:hypothetical protein
LSDRYQVNFISGIYTTLAARFNDGTFYPELYDGEHYGGTRYMPLPFVLQAGLARLTGDYLVAGKLLTYGLVVTLCLQLLLILKRLGCSMPFSLALVCLVLTSAPGYLAATTIRGDLLPVVLQLAALLVGTHKPTARRAVVAGGLCTLAVLAKITAGWAPLALAFFYFRNRRCLGAFLGVWIGSTLVSLVGLHLATSGRMLENFTALSAAGVSGMSGILRAPANLLLQASQDGAAQGFLIPAALVGCFAAARARRLTVYHGALLCCLPILFVIYSDRGSDYNHLLDLVVLAVPAAGCLCNSLAANGPRWAVALVLLWATTSSWANTLSVPVRRVLDDARQGRAEAKRPGRPLTDLIGDDATILSEDPWVPVSRGQVPCVLDPYAFARMSEHRPALGDELARRVRAEEFQRIVLLRPANGMGTEDGGNWYERHLGPAVIGAIRDRYRFLVQSEGYYVYVPKAEPETPSSARASRQPGRGED